MTVLYSFVTFRQGRHKATWQIPKSKRGKKDSAKKIVSLTIDPALIAKIDGYAASKKISRSAAIESSIMGLLVLNSDSAFAVPDNSLVQPEESIFASPQLGTAIHF